MYPWGIRSWRSWQRPRNIIQKPYQISVPHSPKWVWSKEDNQKALHLDLVKQMRESFSGRKAKIRVYWSHTFIILQGDLCTSGCRDHSSGSWLSRVQCEVLPRTWFDAHYCCGIVHLNQDQMADCRVGGSNAKSNNQCTQCSRRLIETRYTPQRQPSPLLQQSSSWALQSGIHCEDLIKNGKEGLLLQSQIAELPDQG